MNSRFEEYESDYSYAKNQRYVPEVVKKKKPVVSKPMEENDDDDTERVECRICGRKFASDRIDKHEAACEKAHKKKKKVFDSRMMRLQGSEAVKYIDKMDQEEKTKPKPKVPKYKLEHERLIETLKASRMQIQYEKDLEAGKAVGPPPKLPEYKIIDDDRVECPHCGRKFAKDAAQRHIPTCEKLSQRSGKPRGRK